MTGGRPERLGPWRIEDLMGEGTFAEVWRAHHVDRPDQRAAIKVLRPEWRTRSTFRQRFLDEAATMELLGKGAARIPALTASLGHDCEGPTPWIAVEYIDGRPVDRVLEDGRLPDGSRVSHDRVERAAFAAKVIRAVAEALAFAHRRGIVHRDVKPENILIDRNGRIVIIDFGIARDARGRRHTGTDAPSPMTPDYAAPELLEGRVTEHLESQLDVYALGCTLYELLGGLLPEISQTQVAGRRPMFLPRRQPLNAPVGTPAHLAALVELMTAPQATERPSIGQIIAAIDSETLPSALSGRVRVPAPPKPESVARNVKGDTLYPGRDRIHEALEAQAAADQTWAATRPGVDGSAWSPAPNHSGVTGLVAGILGTLALLTVAIAGGVFAFAAFGEPAAAPRGLEDAKSTEADTRPAAPPPRPRFALPPANLPRAEGEGTWGRGRVADAPEDEKMRARAAAEIEFTSQPPGMLVRVEGRTIGRTPTSQRLVPGPYLVEFSDGSDRRYMRIVKGGRGETVDVDAREERELTQIVLTARHTGGVGVLRVDGRPVGRPPQIVEVSPGLHRVEFVADGRQPVGRSVHVRPGGLERVDL